MNHGGGEPSLASLIERSAELKRTLVDFALSPRFERHLEQFMLEAADPYQELSEGEAIGVIDRFALQHRLPNGKTILDQFLAVRPDLTAAHREMLRGWRDPVEGIFEIRPKNRDSLVLLNLLDDLEYHVYSNMGPAAFRRLPKGGFVHVRLVPICPVPAPGWSPARCRPTASLALRRSRRPRSRWRRNSPTWSTVIPRKSSKPGR
jgi:hypothetical protein